MVGVLTPPDAARLPLGYLSSSHVVSGRLAIVLDVCSENSSSPAPPQIYLFTAAADS